MNQRDRIGGRELLDALEATLDKVVNAEQVVGQYVPQFVVEWAFSKGLRVKETEFAPPDKLYIIGAIQVEYEPRFLDV